MSLATSRIKNLSIALEAISRVNGCRSEYDRIQDLLSEALDEEKENQKGHLAWPAQPTIRQDDELPSR